MPGHGHWPPGGTSFASRSAASQSLWRCSLGLRSLPKTLKFILRARNYTRVNNPQTNNPSQGNLGNGLSHPLLILGVADRGRTRPRGFPTDSQQMTSPQGRPAPPSVKPTHGHPYVLDALYERRCI